jgi:DNA-binding response OmpR family regulator
VSHQLRALVLLNASQPALLIANVLLPGGGDGLRLREAARTLGVPTLLISGHPEVIAKAQGLPFLSKPFRLTELLQVIRNLLEHFQSLAGAASGTGPQ